MNSFARAIVIAATSLVAVTVASAARSRIWAQARGGRPIGFRRQRSARQSRHQIPEPTMANAITVAGALEQDYGAKDYGVAPK